MTTDSQGLVVTLDLPDTDATHALGLHLATLLRAGDLVVLTGELGAGKTALTRGIGEGLGVRGAVTSPTFVVARVHPSLTGGPDLVHVDAYRMSGPAEVDDLDLDANVPTSVTVVEWGRGLVEHLTGDRLDVELLRTTGQAHGRDQEAAASVGREASAEPGEDEDGAGYRRAVLTGHGPRWDGVALMPGDASGR